MLRRRLYLQIYLTIIASLVLVVVLAAVLWSASHRGRPDRDGLEMIARLASLSLPVAAAPAAQQQAAVSRMGTELTISVSLFGLDRALIARHGAQLEPPDARLNESSWRRRNHPPTWYLRLPDGRWLAAGQRDGGWRGRSVLDVMVLLGSIALGIGLGAYPFVRRLTRRLERLQRGVEEIATGDLSARVEIGGRDEVAALADSFNAAAAKIQALLDAHRMLLANASHELRTPLSRIRLGVEMLKQGGDPAREAALQADILELDELIDEILMMSRLDAGTDIDLMAEVDLTALAAEECARYPECTLNGTAPVIAGDARMLRRMIRNLLANAGTHGKPPILVDLSAQADRVTIEVSDHGPGIPPEAHESVFEAFYRLPGRQNVRGFGLGLALVRQIAARHGGTAVIARNGTGRTTVRVTVQVTLGFSGR